MATVRISARFTDNDGEDIVIGSYWDATDVTTIAEAQAAATALEDDLNDLSGAKISEMWVTFPLNDVAAAPIAGYSVHNGVTFKFTDSDGAPGSLFVPAPLEVIMTGDQADASNGFVSTFLANVITNGFGTHRLSSQHSGALWNTFRGSKRA